MIPIAGSAYTYGYATLGELVAWIIGWDLVLEYAFGAATVASGGAGTSRRCCRTGISTFRRSSRRLRGNALYFYQGHWQAAASLPGVDLTGLPHVTGVANLVAFFAILIVTAVLVIGIQESANLNSAIVIVKLAVVGIFIVLGGSFLLHHPELAHANWHPFIPPKDAAGTLV